jgi:hypothetical protein
MLKQSSTYFANRSLVIRSVTMTPSLLQSQVIDPPSWTVMPRLRSLLPYPLRLLELRPADRRVLSKPPQLRCHVERMICQACPEGCVNNFWGRSSKRWGLRDQPRDRERFERTASDYERRSQKNLTTP